MDDEAKPQHLISQFKSDLYAYTHKKDSQRLKHVKSSGVSPSFIKNFSSKAPIDSKHQSPEKKKEQLPQLENVRDSQDSNPEILDKRMFEVLDRIYNLQKHEFEHDADYQSKRRLKQLNSAIGYYKSVNSKNQWIIDDPVLYDIALERYNKIEQRVTDKFMEDKQKRWNKQVTELNNRSAKTEAFKTQQEMLRGNFELQINEKLKTNKKIERFAEEPVAFHLHKKRDFLTRIFTNQKRLKEIEIIHYQKILKQLAAMKVKKSQANSPKEKARTNRYFFMKAMDQASMNKTISTITPSVTQNDDVFKWKKQESDDKILPDEEVKELLDRALQNLSQTRERTKRERMEYFQQKKRDSLKKIQKLTRDLKAVEPIEYIKQVQDGQLSGGTGRKLDVKAIQEKYTRTNSKEKKVAQTALAKQSLYSNNFQMLQSRNNRTQPHNVSKTDGSGDEETFRQNLMFNKLIDRSRNKFDSSFFFTQDVMSSSMGMRHSLEKISKQQSNINLSKEKQPTQEGKRNTLQAQISSAYGTTRLPRQRNQNPLIFSFQESLDDSSPLSKQQGAFPKKLSKKLESFSRNENQERLINQKSHAQRKIDQLIKDCRVTSYNTQKNINQLEVQRNALHQVRDGFQEVADTLKELEGIDQNVIETIFEYKKLDRQENREESRVVTKEYKSGMMDPSRIVARLEQKQNKKKNKVPNYQKLLALQQRIQR